MLLRLSFLAGFAAFSLVVAAGSLRSFDIAATRAVQFFPTAFFDYASLFFTILGSGELTGAASLVFAWYIAGKRGGYREAFLFLAFFGLSVAVELALKFTIPQPKVFEEFRRGLRIPVPIYSPLTPFAYPSGHATRSTILVGFLYYLAGGFSNARKVGLSNRGAGGKDAGGGQEPPGADAPLRIAGAGSITRAAIVLVYIAMLVSRVYEGAHWSCDVIGGVLLGGFLLASIISAVNGYFLHRMP